MLLQRCLNVDKKFASQHVMDVEMATSVQLKVMPAVMSVMSRDDTRDDIRKKKRKLFIYCLLDKKKNNFCIGKFSLYMFTW